MVIGPWSIIGENVEIGEGCEIGPHVIIKSNTRIGKNNKIYQFSSIGEDPSDMKFAGEETWLEIGDNNIIREGCDLHRGTAGGGGVTRIGNHNLLMPYVHIAHDCQIANHVILANNAALTGHVEISDWVVFGGYVGVNQFLKLGAHCFVGGMTHITHDVPAYVIVSGTPPTVRSINSIGLGRRGFSKQTILQIKRAFKIVYKKGYSLQEALSELEILSSECAEVRVLMDSINASTKGIHR